jgi:hypothetical protein
MGFMPDNVRHGRDIGHAGRSPTLTLLGGAGAVTGSKTLLETAGSRVLARCHRIRDRRRYVGLPAGLTLPDRRIVEQELAQAAVRAK